MQCLTLYIEPFIVKLNKEDIHSSGVFDSLNTDYWFIKITVDTFFLKTLYYINSMNYMCYVLLINRTIDDCLY